MSLKKRAFFARRRVSRDSRCSQNVPNFSDDGLVCSWPDLANQKSGFRNVFPTAFLTLLDIAEKT